MQPLQLVSPAPISGRAATGSMRPSQPSFRPQATFARQLSHAPQTCCTWVVVKIMALLDPYYNTAPNMLGTQKRDPNFDSYPHASQMLLPARSRHQLDAA